MVTKIATLIVDDDPHAQTIISRLVQMNPLLALAGVSASALEAYAVLAEKEIDLLICDIEMPGMTGIQFVQRLQHPPLVIFLTAHPHYALSCYEVSPVDFLLKPLDPVRFFAGVEKVRQRLGNPVESGVTDPYFFVRDGQDYVQIRCHDVLYMQAENDLLHIVTGKKTYAPFLSISRMEEKLKNELFIRVHRSYLVHRPSIARIGKNELVLTSGHSIPIGEQYRDQLHRRHVAEQFVSRR